MVSSRILPLGVGEFFGFKENLQFSLSAGGAVTAVHGVLADAVTVKRANGTGSSFFRIGGAHDLTIARDCIFTFEGHQQHGSRSHEAHEFAEERAIFVFGVKLFALGALNFAEFRGGDLQDRSFQTAE